MHDFRDLVMAGRGAVCEAHVGRRPLVHSDFVRRVETDGDSKPASCIEFFGEWRRRSIRLPISGEGMTKTRRALQRFRTQKTRLSTALKSKHVINGK